MMAIRDYKDLLVWQKAMDLAELVYRITESFPAREMYGLTKQVRRAAVSVPSNIAEGQGRNSTGEFRHFLGVARGSLLETETLGYLDRNQSGPLFATVTEVAKMLRGLNAALPK